MPVRDELGRWISEFFQNYLLSQRGLSRHTILSYRDAIKLMLGFAAQRAGRDVVDIGVGDLDVPAVLAFLEDLESRRGCTASTRNQRLAALHSFFRYLGASCPEHLSQCQRILSIQVKRTKVPFVDYLEQDELSALFAVIDPSTMLGLRDLALFTFLYNTGARVQEAVDLRPAWLQLDPPPWVRIVGKGRKTRACPLWPETVARIRSLLHRRQLPSDHEGHLFVNRAGTPLTRFGVRYLLTTYVDAASAQQPSLKSKSVHPHTIRHTTAVHMLQAGVELNMIRAWLGHVHIDTTNRYAEIDLALKRRILEATGPMAGRTRSGEKQRQPRARWHHDSNLLRWLDRI
jgi:site-specific recombinase XerD